LHGNVLFTEIDGREDFAQLSPPVGGYTSVRWRGANEPTFIVNRYGEIVMQEDGVWLDVIGNGLFSRSSFGERQFIRDKYDATVVDINGNEVFPHNLILLPQLDNPHFFHHMAFIGGAYDVDGYVAVYTFQPSLYTLDLDNLVRQVHGYGIFCLRTNTFVTEPIFYSLTPFNNGKAIARTMENPDVVIIIDREGNEVANLTQNLYPLDINTNMIMPFGDGVTPIHFNSGGNPMIINDRGEVVSDTDFLTIHRFNDDGIALFSIRVPGRRYGFVNARGEVILPPEFSFASSMYQNIAFVTRNRQQYRFVFSPR
jgi:hypothetical protein